MEPSRGFPLARAAALAAVLLTLGCQQDRGPAYYDLAITDADVIPMTDDTVLTDRTVLVREGRIVRVDRSGQVQVQDGPRVVQADGAYVMPGLHDMHVHLPTDGIVEALGLEGPDDGIRYGISLAPYLANGITTIRVMSGAPDLLRLRDSVAAGEVVGPRMIVGSPMIDGAPPILPEPITRVVESRKAAAEIVRIYAEAGYDFLKIRSGVSRSVFDALRRNAGRTGMSIVGHVPEEDSLGLDYVLNSGPFGVPHLEEFPSGGRGQTEEDLNAFVELAVATDATVATTLTVHADLLEQIEDPSGALGAPGAEYVPDYLLTSFWRSSVLNQDTTARRAAAVRRQLDFLQQLARRLYEADVPVMVGTDALVPTVTPGFSIHREVQLLAATKLHEYEVLRMATVIPAVHSSGSPTAGTVSSGERADLVLLARNPLENLEALTDIQGVIVGGRFVNSKELADQLERVTEEYLPSEQ